MDASRLIINDSGVLKGCSSPDRDLLIPEGVTAIGDWAFYGCTASGVPDRSGILHS